MNTAMKNTGMGLRTGLTVVLLSALVLISGCGKRQSLTDKHYYRWQPDLSWVKPMPEMQQEPLYIPRAQALGVVGSRPILARADDGSLVQMHHHFWLDSPRVMWQNTLLEWASRKQGWAEVRAIKPIHPNHFTLLSTLLALEKDGNTAHLALRIELLDASKQLRYQATFKRQAQLSENSIGAFVAAINGLSAAILQEMDTGIRQALNNQPGDSAND